MVTTGHTATINPAISNNTKGQLLFLMMMSPCGLSIVIVAARWHGFAVAVTCHAATVARGLTHSASGCVMTGTITQPGVATI